MPFCLRGKLFALVTFVYVILISWTCRRNGSGRLGWIFIYSSTRGGDGAAVLVSQINGHWCRTDVFYLQTDGAAAASVDAPLTGPSLASLTNACADDHSSAVVAVNYGPHGTVLELSVALVLVQFQFF